jgi:peptidoglycan/xylan/chitin deacetylase (PgdA/CDA1 family)
MMGLRSLSLYVLRALGAFAAAQYFTRHSLRILCYHGFSVGDEHEVAPVMFMRAETFERRMRILRKRRIPVLSLEEGVTRLQRGEIANAETVITFDDGWASNLTIAQPILERFGYPVCIYISTEHLTAGTEVFNVAVSYMMHRCGLDTLTLRGLHPQVDGSYEIGRDPAAATLQLIGAAERAWTLVERQRALRPIAQALGLDLDEVLMNGRFRLLSRADIQQLSRGGVNIELHTHTHRLPDHDFSAMAAEIEQNRRAITELLGTIPRHFCYPSGDYSEHHPEWLRKMGILSGTTCDPGFNDVNTSVMLLKRYLDSDHSTDIAFEAEICGVRELARRIRARVIRRTRATPVAGSRPA